VLEQPLRRRRPHLPAAAPFCLASLLHRDPAVDLGEGRRRLLDHHAPSEVERLKPRRFIVPSESRRERQLIDGERRSDTEPSTT
jgi:hypothetical protein